MIPPLDPSSRFGRWRVPALIVLAVALDVVLTAVYATDRLLSSPLGHHFSGLVDLDAEQSVPTWFSSIKLFLLGVMLLVVAVGFINRGLRRAWIMVALSLALLVMSMDEVATIHERIGLISDRLLPGGHRDNTVFSATGIWMFLLGIPAFFGLLWSVLALKDLWQNPRATRLFIVGVIVFLGSAVGLEILTNFVTGRMLVLQVMAEEFGELLGVSIMLWGAYELADSQGVAVVWPVDPVLSAATAAQDGQADSL